METNNEKQVIAKEALKALSDIEDTLKLEGLIKDNKIAFEVEGVKYQLRQPTFAETTEIEEAKRKQYLKFMQDDSYLFRKQWIANYAKKGIDIPEMEKKISMARHEMEQTMLRLATTQEPKAIESLKNEILKLKDEQFNLGIKITDLLSYSIEEQLNIFYLSYVTYLVFEKQVEDNWERVFTSYEESRKSELKATQTALYYISYLIYNNER